MLPTVKGDLLMSLYTQYLAILEMAGTPPNEAATCRWIIDPVLTEVLGYGRTEWVPEETDKAGTKPDYTILPNTGHTWFLEAKSYSIALTEQHVRQATPYAHQSGQRWVALTNGIEWRLYDLDLPGEPPNKLAMRAHRDQPEEMEALLAALTRESVTGGGLAEAARRATLSRFVREQLASPGSALVKQIWSLARKQPGLTAVTQAEVFGAIISPMTRSGQPSAAPVAVTVKAEPPLQPTGWVTLSDETLNPTNASIVEVRCPDGSVSPVKAWRQALLVGVEWMVAHAPCAVPVPLVGRSGHRYTNRTPEAAPGKPMHSPHSVAVGETAFYLETHGSAAGLLTRLRWLCAEVGVDAGGFTFRLNE
jgi:hypothetical protein